MSKYPPPGAARKKSTPTPAATILSAVFRQPGCSVLKSFLSASPPCCLPSSRRKSRPGPQVGKADREQMIFPPVFSRAASAALRVGSSAGSGFLTFENNAGSWLSSDIIFDLQSSATTDNTISEQVPTSPRKDPQRARHSKARTDLRYRA